MASKIRGERMRSCRKCETIDWKSVDFYVCGRIASRPRFARGPVSKRWLEESAARKWNNNFFFFFSTPFAPRANKRCWMAPLGDIRSPSPKFIRIRPPFARIRFRSRRFLLCYPDPCFFNVHPLPRNFVWKNVLLHTTRVTSVFSSFFLFFLGSKSN